MMRISTKRILSILFAGIFLIGTGVVYSTLIRGEGKVVSEKRGEVAAKSNLLKTEETAVDRVQNLIKQYKDIAALQATVTLSLPSGPQTVNAMHHIEAMAGSSNVILTSLKFTPIIPRSAAKTFVRRLGILEVTVSASGNYQNLKQFLGFVETGVRVANVRDFKFQPGTAKDAPESLTMVVEMYYQE